MIRTENGLQVSSKDHPPAKERPEPFGWLMTAESQLPGSDRDLCRIRPECASGARGN